MVGIGDIQKVIKKASRKAAKTQRKPTVYWQPEKCRPLSAKPQPLVSQSQICQQLLFVHGNYFLHCFELNNHLVFDKNYLCNFILRHSFFFAALRLCVSKKLNHHSSFGNPFYRKRMSPAAAVLIFLDSRFHGNDNKGCFLTFYEFINC